MKITTLLKARLKENLFTATYLKDLYRRDRLWVLPLAGFGIIAAAGGFIVMLFQNYSMLYKLGADSGAPETVMLFSGIISGLLVFFIGTPLCLSNIFYSRDNALAASLPVSNSDIVISRILSLYLFTLPIHLLLTVPALVVFLPQQPGVSAAVSGVLVLVSGSVLPLVFAFAASAVLVRIGNLTGKNTAVEIIGMTFAVLLLGAIQITAGRSLFTGSGMSDLAATLMNYADTLKRIFFASEWTAKGFTGGNFAYSLIGIAFRIFIAVSFSLLLNLLRFNVVAAGMARNRGRKNKQPGSRERKSSARTSIGKPGTVGSALLRREWMVVRSNSAFLFEIAGEVFILPILLAVFYFSLPGEITDMISELTAGISFLPGVVFLMLILMSSINSISSTSLSREGAGFAISKYLPISGSTQVKSKMYFHMLLLTLSWMMNLTILMMILKLPAVNLLYLIPAGPAVILLSFIVSIHIDLARPVLKWTHPQQAMKQNMNVLIGLGFGLLLCAALAVPGALLYLAGLSPLICGLASTAAAAVLDVILLPKIMKYSDERYIEISV